MGKDQTVEKFHEELRELLTRLSTAGYVVKTIKVDWIDVSTQDVKEYRIKGVYLKLGFEYEKF